MPAPFFLSSKNQEAVMSCARSPADPRAAAGGSSGADGTRRGAAPVAPAAAVASLRYSTLWSEVALKCGSVARSARCAWTASG